jgi:dihydrofolate reductase
MRIILSDFMSLDGVVQAPGGKEEDTDGGFAHGGWSMRYFDPEAMGAAIDDVMQGTEALLFGRRTWRVMADAWPGRAGDPFADTMNELPKYVASRTLTESDLEWNTTLLPADDAIGAIRRLRESDGGGMQVMGSASLAEQLVASDLVDEYRLMLEPVLLGGGKRIFPSDGTARPLELVSTTTAGTGVLICTYRPVAS